MIGKLTEFLKSSLTAYQACENVAAELTQNGFERLLETEDWAIREGGKYFVVRGGSGLIAFTVGSLDGFSYKIAASHVDSPALKLKENAVKSSGVGAVLNVETYGGGLWYSYLDRPLRIAGRVIKREGETLKAYNVEAPFLVTIPSLAVHMNRGANDGFAIDPQTDLLPLAGLENGLSMKELLEKIAGEGVIAHDLYLVNGESPYSFGVADEFLAAPRIDNLTSVYASIQALLSHAESDGVCVAACLDNEETGSLSAQGADGDFLENVLRRIAYALRFDDNEYYKALAGSFMLSLDNAHAKHPNHPEKSDPTNETKLGGGVVVKQHANRAYITDAESAAVVKTVLDNAGVRYQSFFNRSNMRSGSTLGAAALRHVGVPGADIGLAQLAMHSACECFAKADYEQLVKGVAAYFAATIERTEDGIAVR